jgi:hypothetical protein
LKEDENVGISMLENKMFHHKHWLIFYVLSIWKYASNKNVIYFAFYTYLLEERNRECYTHLSTPLSPLQVEIHGELDCKLELISVT